MKFSERKGLAATSNIIQKDGISQELRNAIWNVVLEFKINVLINEDREFGKRFWCSLLKRPFDEIPANVSVVLRGQIISAQWFEAYDALEFLCSDYQQSEFNDEINRALERELGGYRIVSGLVAEITDQQEVEMLEEALSDEAFPNVIEHLQRALELMSDREKPDYRNSIKESISAVESTAKAIAKKPKAELKEALGEIEKNGKLHAAMKKAFLSLYGYTSDANGIRHALMEEPNLTASDAKFFLLACTSFINYLKTKI